MTDAERAPEVDRAPAVPVGAGEQLRAAREAKGLSLADVAARTRVPLRHLSAIENGDYAGLPSPTYAVGFARAYARSVDADEVAVAAAVREEVSKIGRAPEYEPYATADPDRVPPRGLAIVAAGLAVAIVVLALLWFGTSWWQARQPAAVASDAPVAAASPTPSAASTPAPVTGGQVKLTATDEVWLRVADAAGKTLYIGTLKSGESFDVPAGADHPTLTVGRPDKLQVTLDGKALPPLGTGERPIKNVAVDGAAIAARLAAGGAVPVVTPAPAASPTAAPPAPRATARPLTSDEQATARANRSSGRAAARGETPPAPTPSATSNTP